MLTKHSKKMDAILNILHENVLAEKIFLLPSVEYSISPMMPRLLPDVHLLVLYSEVKPSDRIVLQNYLEKACLRVCLTNIIALDVQPFNMRLAEQTYFFPELKNSELLYDYCHFPLPSKRKEMDVSEVCRIIRQLSAYYFSEAEKIIRLIYNSTRAKENIVLELISEAIKHVYTAIEITFTGRNPETDNILALRRSSSRFSEAIGMLFPNNSHKESRLLFLINQFSQKKYIRKSATIEEREAAIARAEDCLMVAQLICSKHINGLI